MANKKYIMVSMDDERAGKIAEILGNKSSKKLLDFLSEKNEASEKEIAEALQMPINTVEYNLNKLLHVELIEKTKNFFWSSKGKKIPMYKLSNKSIIISPKKSHHLKTLLPVAVISVIAAFIVRQLTTQTSDSLTKADYLYATSAGNSLLANIQALPIWVWFLFGASLAIILFLLVNMIIQLKGGTND